MGKESPFRDHYHHSHSHTRKLLSCTIYSILLAALFYIYGVSHQFSEEKLHNSTKVVPFTSSAPSSSSKDIVGEEKVACDYTNGSWVRDKMEPLYNATTCGTIKESRNCIVHGRPDMDYIYWRWKPQLCNLPRFDPNSFLQLLRDKHLAFIGDSLGRNQQESLLCMLATVSTPTVVYSDGWVDKFKRWYFESHNITVSAYWSPFLVRSVDRLSAGSGEDNKVFLDEVDERWVSELGSIDVIVLSCGHWFLTPSVFYENGSVMGCHLCPNHTEVGFYEALGKALNTAFRAIAAKKGCEDKRAHVVLTSFPPSHFEGEWQAGVCPKTEPYRDREMVLEGMNAEIRGVQVRETEAAKEKAKAFGGLRIEMLDITKLSLMRPDGHPGPYMKPFPFDNGGVQGHVQNDCVHWCLPGPVDTWNDILLALMKRWI